MDFKFRNKYDKNVFLLVCENIEKDNFYFTHRDVLNESKSTIIIDGLNFRINVSTENIIRGDDGVFCNIGNLYLSKLNIRVQKIDIEYGGCLFSHSYGLTNCDGYFGYESNLTDSGILVDYIIQLMNDNRVMFNRPKKRPKKSKGDIKNEIDTFIKSELRDSKINSIL